jgi:hypothetical protein
VEVIFNGMTSLLKFINIYQLVQKLMGEQMDRHANRREDGDLISLLLFSFTKESRLKMCAFILS